MDSEGGANPLPGPDPAAPEGAEDNVDQYFDDGGETFLPADHVSYSFRSL